MPAVGQNPTRGRLPRESISEELEALAAPPLRNSAPVVLLSAAAGQRRVEPLPLAGAYLAKPFHLDTLFRLVERHADQMAEPAVLRPREVRPVRPAAE